MDVGAPPVFRGGNEGFGTNYQVVSAPRSAVVGVVADNDAGPSLRSKLLEQLDLPFGFRLIDHVAPKGEECPPPEWLAMPEFVRCRSSLNGAVGVVRISVRLHCFSPP